MARLALAALLAAAAIGAAAAAPPPEEGYFGDYLTPRSSVKAKQAGDGYYRDDSYEEREHHGEGYSRVDVKHVCLTEKGLKNCRYVGCQNAYIANSTCTGTPIGCSDCISNLFTQTDLGCCGGEDPYGYHDYHGSWSASGLTVGSCDWDVNLYKAIGAALNKYAPVQIAGKQTWKIGSAWGTCTLYDSAGECGAPLCDKMVLSFQGGIYYTGANSRTANTTNAVDSAECSTLIDGITEDWPPININFTRTAGGGDGQRIGERANQGIMNSLLSATGLGSMLRGAGAEIQSADAKEGEAETEYYRGGVRVNPDSGYYVGAALVVSGPFTVTSLEHETEFEAGMLEFTPRFTTFQTAPGPKKAGWPVLRPQAVKLRFVKNGDRKY